MKTKPIFLAVTALAVLGFSLAAPVLSTGQTVSGGPSDGGSKSLTALLQEVQAQQKMIADNQAKMDEKMAAIAENLRQARIYISRGR